ncbi:hypothetical protein ABKV19_014463 [Rosa sericea]
MSSGTRKFLNYVTEDFRVSHSLPLKQVHDQSNPEDDGEELNSSGLNNASEEVEPQSNAEEDDNQGKVDDSDTKSSKPPGEQSADNMDAPAEDADEGKLDGGNSKPLDDHTDASPDVEKESNAVEEESNESKKKPRLPMKKKSQSRSGVKKRKDEPSGIRQLLNTAGNVDLDEAEQSEDGDNDEEPVPESNPEDDNEELISGGSNTADEKGEHSIADEQQPNERHGEPLSHQSETKNTDSAQHVEEESNTVEEESKDSKNKFSLPKKEKSPSSSGVKKGKEKSSGIRKVPITASNFDLDGAIQSQDGNNDAAEEHQLEPHDVDEELNSSGSNNAREVKPQSNADEDESDERHHKPLDNQSENDDGAAAQDVEQESNAVEEKTNECSHKPFSNQSETNITDATQDVEKAHAAEKDSNDSKTKSRPLKKDKASSSRGHPQGKLQHSRFDQVLNATGNIYPDGAVQSQEDDNDEAVVQELESQHDGEELNLGGSNNVDEGVERRSDEHEKESDERHGKPLINQSESDNTEAAQDVEKEPHEGEEKQYGLEQKSYESEKRSLQMKNPSGRRSGKQKPFKFGQALNIASNVDLDGAVKSQEDDNHKAEVQESEPQEDGGDLNLGGPNNANEDVELPSKVDEEISDEPLCNKIESGDIEVTQDVEQQSDEVKRKLINSKETFFQKKKHSSHLTGKQKASIVGQVSDVVSNFDLDGAMQSQDIDADEVKVHESESQNDFEKLEVGSSKNDQRGQQARTRARSREQPLNLERLISTASGTDSSRAMVSLDDEEGKVEELNPFASARGDKQALSKATVPNLIQITATNVDDSSEELKSVGADNYKDDKAKAHEVKFGGSKKDLRGRQHHTQEREELKLFNLEKVVTTASGSDSGKALVSFDDEDEKIQESEPIASNVDSYFRQPLSSAQGIDQSPNLVQILTSKIDDDPNVELKSLGDGNYKGKKAKVYQLSKDSRKIKGHTMGARTRIEPPNLDQIVTAGIGDDLGEGLESLGGNEEGESDKDGSNKDFPGSGQTSRGTQQLPNLVQILTATNEGDPNPELEFCEDDKELESEYSMSDLSLQEPASGEIEPSTDDQSVFVTVDDDPDVVQFHYYNEYDEEPAESNKDGRTGKPLSRPPTTSLRGKRRA